MSREVHRELVYRPLQFQKRSQDFLRARDEPLPIAMRINNPDRRSFPIHS